VRATAAAALAFLSLALTGCGPGVGVAVSGDTDKSHGKQLFQEKCASCHTLAEAKSQGKLGPDLDAAFRPDRKQGFQESTVRQVVADQIKFPGDYGAKGPTMPKDLVEGSDVDDVAAYVAYVAGQKGVSVTASSPAPGTTQTETTPPSGGGGDVEAGKKAFTDNGCGSCHTLEAAGSNGTVGPDLDKLKTYAADAKKPLDQFIHESIVDPNAYVEKGYPKGIMPAFSSLPKSTIDALVAFLAASAK
jgi:mono/diheme cytochrome c family protein